MMTFIQGSMTKELEKEEDQEIINPETSAASSEKRFQEIVDQVNLGIIVLQDYDIKYVNRTMSRLSGQTTSDLIGFQFWEMIHPDYFEKAKIVYDDVINDRLTETVQDFLAVEKNGNKRWFEVKPVKISWKDKPALLCTIADVTERKQIEEELVKSEHRFKTILDSTGYGYYETDGNGTFMFLNDQLASIIGYPREKIIGMSYADFTDQETAQKTYQVYDSIYKARLPFGELEHVVMRSDGSRVYVHMSITTLVDDNDQPIGFKGLVHDITPQKENEFKLAELHRKQIDLAHAAGMAEMASNTLHNVGNILNSVKTSGQAVANLFSAEPYSMKSLIKANAMLKDNLDNLDEFISKDTDGKKLINYLVLLIDEIVEINRDANKDVTRLLDNIRLIENVVSAQQAYAGLGSLTEVYSLVDIVEDSLVLRSSLIQSENVKVVKQFDKIQPIPVQKAKLIHILINLINNAVDAMAQIPEAERVLQLTIEQDEISIFLKVRDQGKGIEREKLQKIFTHGFTTKENGHGFGLHSSAIYMAAMNGRIWAESDGPGHGACFVLRFKKG